MGLGWLSYQKIKPCRFIARMIALIYNWWSLFVRLAEPDKLSNGVENFPVKSVEKFPVKL